MAMFNAVAGHLITTFGVVESVEINATGLLTKGLDGDDVVVLEFPEELFVGILGNAGVAFVKEEEVDEGEESDELHDKLLVVRHNERDVLPTTQRMTNSISEHDVLQSLC